MLFTFIISVTTNVTTDTEEINSLCLLSLFMKFTDIKSALKSESVISFLLLFMYSRISLVLAVSIVSAWLIFNGLLFIT